MELQLAKGVKDTPPEERIVELRVLDILRNIFELYGYSPLETPILERFDILASKYAGGAEILKETFKLKDQGERDLALRYDLTVPFARFIGINRNLKMPFKRYQVGKVFRDGPISSERLREFWQCDIDVVGIPSMTIDAEFIDIFSKVFKELGIKVEVRVNNRKILDAIMSKADIKNSTEVILIIDKLEKIGQENVKKELREKGLSQDQVRLIIGLINLKGENKEKIKELKNQLGNNDGIYEMEQLIKYAKSNFIFDLSLARGLVYYTGTIYEVFATSESMKSSLASGGRYNNMIGDFLQSKEKYPAIGISFGLSRICSMIKKDNQKTNTKVYVIPIGIEAFDIVNKLRENKINTDTDYSGRGISKNLDYANALGIPYVMFVGEDEVKKNKFKLRNMNTGKEDSLEIDKIINKLKNE